MACLRFCAGWSIFFTVEDVSFGSERRRLGGVLKGRCFVIDEGRVGVAMEESDLTVEMAAFPG